jgi:hypothetical protein
MICCWLAASMPWVLMTPLGRPVEPEVNRNFAIVAASPRATACSTAGPGFVAASAAKAVTSSRFAPLRPATISTPPRSSEASAAANGAVSAT